LCIHHLLFQLWQCMLLNIKGAFDGERFGGLTFN